MPSLPPECFLSGNVILNVLSIKKVKCRELREHKAKLKPCHVLDYRDWGGPKESHDKPSGFVHLVNSSICDTPHFKLHYFFFFFKSMFSQYCL